MPKIKFNCPDDVEENIHLTRIKLPTIGVFGQSNDGSVRIYMSSDRKLKNLVLDDELLQAGDKNRIQTNIREALQVVLDAVEEVRETEFKGRLRTAEKSYPWSAIHALIS